MSPEDSTSKEKIQHSGMLPTEHGGERPEVEFDNTPLSDAVNEGLLSFPVVEDGSRAEETYSPAANVTESDRKWYQTRSAKVGAGLLAVSAAVATTVGLMLPRGEATSTAHNKTPAQTNSTELAPTPSATASEKLPFISPQELIAMPLSQFESLPRQQQLVLTWDRLGYGLAQGTLYGNTIGNYDPGLYNPTHMASEKNTDDQIVKQVWYTEQTAFLQCAPSDIGVNGACKTNDLDADLAQKTLDGVYYNPKPLDGVLNAYGVADHTKFVGLGFHYSAPDSSTTSPIKEIVGKNGETVTYKDIPFIETQHDGTQYHAIMRAVWTPITVEKFHYGQPDGYMKTGLWQQYQIADSADKLDSSAF